MTFGRQYFHLALVNNLPIYYSLVFFYHSFPRVLRCLIKIIRYRSVNSNFHLRKRFLISCNVQLLPDKNGKPEGTIVY